MRQPASLGSRITLAFAGLAALNAVPLAGYAQERSASSEEVREAAVQQPRPYGYVIGDVVMQRVLLRSDVFELVPAELPRMQRIGVWLERRLPRIETDSDGRRWLAVEYQLVNAPSSLTSVTLPQWELESVADGSRWTIPAWRITAGPLTTQSPSQDIAAALRPDREPPSIPTASLRRQVAGWLLALATIAGAWLGWWLWRNWQATRTRPFARALRQMRTLEDGSPEAWQALHRAFDQTAGRVTQQQTLPLLYRRAPHLQPLREAIEQFFQQSSDRFYRRVTPGEPLSVRALCTQLRRLERQHES